MRMMSKMTKRAKDHSLTTRKSAKFRYIVILSKGGPISHYLIQERIKREQRMANKENFEYDLDEYRNRLSKAGKTFKKLLKKNGVMESDESDSDKDPYASSVSPVPVQLPSVKLTFDIGRVQRRRRESRC